MELKKANPELPILIRECSDVQPKLWARYGERPGPGPGTRVGNESWPGGAAPRLSEGTGTRTLPLPVDRVVSEA